MDGFKKFICGIIWLVIAATSTYSYQKTASPGEEEIKKVLKEQADKFIRTAPSLQPADSTQQAAPKPNPWTKSWVLNVSGNQASYQNWSNGGVNTISSAASTLLRIKYNGQVIANSIRVNLKFGQTWLDGEDSKKTSDLINLKNKVDYFLADEEYSAFAEVDFRTQFVKGYDDDYENIISSFMSPGYITESIGFSYQPVDFFSAQLGIGLKQTFVWADSLDKYYGLGKDEDFRKEGGVTISISVDKDFAETFNYSAEMNAFTNLLIPVRSTDIILRNELSGKLNSFLSTVIQFEVQFDDDISRKIQIRQAIQVGFNIKLL